MISSIIPLILFAIILIWIGSLYREKSSPDSFHMAEREVPILGIVASTFTLIGGGEFVTLTALVVLFGLKSLSLFVGAFIGFFTMGVLANRARKVGQMKELFSLPDFFGEAFGENIARLSTAVAALSLFALLMIQFVVGGMLIELTTGIPVDYCIAFMAVVVIIYVFVGGFNGVLTTDILQAAVMIVLLAGVTAFHLVNEGGTIQSTFLDLGIGGSVALFFAGFCAVLGGADVWQRVFAARTSQVARRGMKISGVSWMLFAGLMAALALRISSSVVIKNPDLAFVEFLDSGLEGWILGLVGMMLFSAVLSTADTEIFAISMLINREVGRGKKEVSANVTRGILLVVGIVGASLAISHKDLVDVYFVFLYFTMALGPVAFFRLLGRGNRWTASIGILGGISVLVYLSLSDVGLGGAYPLLIIIPSFPALFISIPEPWVER